MCTYFLRPVCHPRHSWKNELQRLCKKRLEVLWTNAAKVLHEGMSGDGLSMRWVFDPSRTRGKEMYVCISIETN